MANKAVKYPYRKKLTDWIQDYYIRFGWDKNDINWNMITAQIKNMEDKYKYTDLGIIYTMWFMSTVKSVSLLNDCDNGSILNLVPFYYDSAQSYYQRNKELEKIYSEYNFDNEKSVVVNKNNYKTERKKINIDFD
jgi:hypothetical protein